jgi:hypothetical protein
MAEGGYFILSILECCMLVEADLYECSRNHTIAFIAGIFLVIFAWSLMYRLGSLRNTVVDFC